LSAPAAASSPATAPEAKTESKQAAAAPAPPAAAPAAGATHGTGFGTRAIHAGQPADAQSGAVCVPISLATTYVQESPGRPKGGFEYSRSGNPTRNAFEACIAALEGGDHGLAFGSGLACTSTIINMLAAGDHIIATDDVYGGTNRYFSKVAAPFSGLTTSLVDFSDLKNVEAAITAKTKLIWMETPTNPTLKISDIKACCDLAHSGGRDIIVVVDNTFMSPYFQQPLKLGADIVMHSVTKYLNGHSDVVMGMAVTSKPAIYSRLRYLQNAIGGVPSPFDCYMAMRGVKTLHLRMREHATNAMAVARYLEANPLVDRVIYPGLASHPQHELAKRQMSGFGGMITFFLKGGLKESRVFLENLHLFVCAESLGAVESLAEHPAIMTHASVPPEQRVKLGISDSMIRLSVGVEDLDDILGDLKGAFAAIPEAAARSEDPKKAS